MSKRHHEKPTSYKLPSGKMTSNTAQKEHNEQVTQSTSARRGGTFDATWLIIIVVLIVVIVTSVLMNTHRTDETANKYLGAIDVDHGDEKINWERFPTFEMELANSVSITQSGTYHLTGTIDDGFVKINAGAEGTVRLILDNVSITNTTGPAIICTAGEDVVIELVGKNDLVDGETYDTEYDADVTGVIYSKADLTFQGEGSLNLTSNYYDGVVGKDDVKFNAGNYNIDALDDAIRGKDSVYIAGGNFVIKAGADGIKTTNELDVGKGFVLVEGGNFNIKAGAKGIKATKSILIYGGIFAINSIDDAIHSNNYVGIVDGEYVINSSDDGIHADRELIIDGGKVTIAKAYEGMEAQIVKINDGKISIRALDDGINAGGGADESTYNRPGAGAFKADENCTLTISGGEVYVDASGDGIDSNGWLFFNGGNVIVDGPTNDGNGALDAGLGITMTGGKVLAIGSSGMAESLGTASAVVNVSIYLTTAQEAGTIIEIKDTNDVTVMQHTAAKAFSNIVFGSNELQLGSTYTLFLNEEKYTSFTISDINTRVGNTGMNQMMPPGGNTQPREMNEINDGNAVHRR